MAFLELLPAEPKSNTKTKSGNQPQDHPCTSWGRLPFGHRIPAFFLQQNTETPPNGTLSLKPTRKEAP